MRGTGLLLAALVAGEYDIAWDSSDDGGVCLPAGTHFRRLVNGSVTRRGRIELTRQ
jgi:hypothetical protein